MPEYERILTEITDVDADTPFEYDIAKAYSKEILTGYPDGGFRPDETLNRAESALVIFNFYQVKNEHTTDIKETQEIEQKKTSDRKSDHLDWTDPVSYTHLKHEKKKEIFIRVRTSIADRDLCSKRIRIRDI